MKKKKENSQLFADHIILYIENTKDITRKLLELMYAYSKAARYKINTQKSLAFLYINNEKIEKLRKEFHSFTTATKRIKYLGINLPKETKDLYTENYNTDERNKRGHKRMETYTVSMYLKNQYSENEYTTQSNL